MHNRFAALHRFNLASNFVVNCFLDGTEGVHVFDFDLGAKFLLANGSDGNVDIAAQGAFLHVAVADTEIAHDPPQLLGIFSGFLPRTNIRLRDNFHQRYARAVEVH